MNESKQTNENLKYALCYVPIVAIILHFLEKNKTLVLEKHIKYGMALFIFYIILSILISWFLTWLLFFMYIWLSIFLGYKTYSGEDFQIKFIDDFFQIKFINDLLNKSKNNKTEKKDNSEEL